MHSVSVDEFVNQCDRIGMSNFARYLGENFIFSGADGGPSDW